MVSEGLQVGEVCHFNRVKDCPTRVCKAEEPPYRDRSAGTPVWQSLSSVTLVEPRASALHYKAPGYKAEDELYAGGAHTGDSTAESGVASSLRPEMRTF
jgi:hypothetical protein